MRIMEVILAILILQVGCKNAGKSQMDYLRSQYVRLDTVPAESWNSLAHKKIYFGHKSVGQNIIDGLNDVMRDYPSVKLDIRETASAQAFCQPVFAHSMLGRNKFPQSKIEGFRDVIENGVGGNVDIAFFKLCFVDIDHTTDLQAIFNSYVKTVEHLEVRFPGMKIITFTVPLVSQPVGLKSRLNKVLGRMPWYETEHIQRSLYNDMLRKRFKDSLFDLAAIESRINDTKRASFTKGGKRYDILNRSYTDDGGHLNSTGRQIVAIELLCFLAAIGGG